MKATVKQIEAEKIAKKLNIADARKNENSSYFTFNVLNLVTKIRVSDHSNTKFGTCNLANHYLDVTTFEEFKVGMRKIYGEQIEVIEYIEDEDHDIVGTKKVIYNFN